MPIDPSTLRPIDSRRQRPIRALVIGAGAASVEMHLPALAELRDRSQLELASVCDIQYERAARARRRFGFLDETGDALTALQRPDIDAVYIFGSAQLHYEYGLAALRNGKHLFVEKPIAPSYAQAHIMAQTARECGLIAVGGHNRRFYKSLAAVRARAGKMRWRGVEAVFHKPEHGNAVPYGVCSWLRANGIHALDALLYMMGGLPDHLTAFATNATGNTGVGADTGVGASTPSTFSAIMRWPDGAQGVFLCNNVAGARREEYVFHGLGETCSVTNGSLTVHRGGRVILTTTKPPVGDGIAAEHEAFLAAVRSGTEPTHGISVLAPSLFLAELIEDSFSGSIRLPEPAGPERCLPIAAMRRKFEARSILVSQSVELQGALARRLPNYRLIALEDVERSVEPCPDVAAVILGRGSTALTEALLAKLPQLGVIGVVGLSLARLEPESMLARGVTLVNASDAYAQSVAEFALALAVLGRRRAFLSHAVMREGGWGTALRRRDVAGVLRRTARQFRPAVTAAGLDSWLPGLRKAAGSWGQGPAAQITAARDLRGAIVGLIGWGANARIFAHHLHQARARVLVYSEHATKDDISRQGASPASLRETLAADIVSLHRGLTPHTRHFLGTAELAQLRPGALLINIARGALIEPGALLLRLKQGDIFACLDTYDVEPPSASHPLRHLPNVFLTSHIAGGSKDMHAAAAEEVTGKVALLLSGAEVDTISAQQLQCMT